MSEGADDEAALLPRARFEATWRGLGATGPCGEVLHALRAAHDEPHRAYHGARHVAACLHHLDRPEVRALATRIHEVDAAIWFHDAVYDTRASDNEARSAAMAEEALGRGGVDPAVVARIARLVLATRDHASYDADSALVIDVDLSILGEAPEIYARFEEEIRQEYAWVDAPLYVAGRAAVLRRFLDRPAIYATSYFRERLDARARDNLRAALVALGA